MKKSKFSETQIVSILKQGDAGVPVKDLCRQAGISPATYYQWKSKYGGMDASDLRRVKELEEIRSLLGLAEDDVLSCQDVDRLARGHLLDIRNRLNDLQRMASELERVIDRKSVV